MKKKLDLSLYLVLDPGLCGGLEGMLRTTALAVENGVTLVQLRAVQANKGEWYIAAKALMELLAPASVPLIINNEVDVALAVNADGVHIGQDDLPPAVARDLLGRDKILGLSASDEREVVAASGQDVDYLGLGPVYPTTSKPDAAPAVGPDALRRLVRLAGKPTVAIGGINRCNLEEVMASGVGGVAVVSAICGQADVSGATRGLARKMREFRAGSG